MEEKTQIHVEPLPRTKDEVVGLIMEALALPRVEEIRITPSDVSITRVVEEGEEVFPRVEYTGVDPGFVMGRCDLVEMEFDPGMHPYLRLMMASVELLNTDGVSPEYVVAPPGPWLNAYLGIDDEADLTSILGLQVRYSADLQDTGKLVMLGGAGKFLTGMSHGVVVEMGGDQ